MTAHIDKAVEEIERRRKAADREIEYKAFEMYVYAGYGLCKDCRGTGHGKQHAKTLDTAIINELSVCCGEWTRTR